MFWVFVDASQVAGGQVSIAGPQGHHLARVLRVRPGEQGVVVAESREYTVDVTAVENGKLRARVLSEQPARGEPTIAITLLQAVLPNPDFDAVLENGTAVGIARFVAVQAARSIARPPANRLVRWQLIAESAAEQSHRGHVPEVAGPFPLSPALDTAVASSRLLVLDPSGSLSIKELTDDSAAYVLAVGPEGGWTDDELSLMRQRGGLMVNLGPRTLRARLASVVAAAILVQRS